MLSGEDFSEWLPRLSLCSKEADRDPSLRFGIQKEAFAKLTVGILEKGIPQLRFGM